MDRRYRLISAGVLIALALISFLVVGNMLKNPESFSGTIKVLDEKKDTVMALTGAAAASSAAITLIPGDAGTPIAEKLVDMSGYFMIILAAIFLEKWLVSVVGAVAFMALIPIGLIGLAVDLFLPQHAFRPIFLRVICFAVMMFLAVPTSVWLSQKVDDTYGTTIDEIIEEAEQKSAEVQEQAGDETSENVLEKIFNSVKGGVNGKIAEFRTILSRFVEVAAVLIVTSCVIPLAVMIFFIWLIRMLIGVKIDVPIMQLSEAFRK